jgi:acetyl-CoA carboxylase carboxyl transferase subunit alpha
MKSVGDAIVKQLEKLDNVDPGQLRAKRRQKFLDMGKVGLS